jgi:tRNA modification GTPase
MQARLSDTIFALASGQGRAALAVIRVSGRDCGPVVTRLCGALPPPRRASLRTLRNASGAVLDHALVLWFPGPASYTGEDCCELQVHGGLAVIEGVITALASLGARPADPGEFTRRAVIRGHMDLLEAEAVADLIDAETAAQRDQAVQQLGGALGAIYGDWAARLLRLLAQQEALIDFPDEDLPAAVAAQMRADMLGLLDVMRDHLNDSGRGERLRTGLVFAIAGAPNVGKSTLINALCRRDVAIVSPMAGTTRDVLEARLELAGIPVTLLDTAGLRETEDAVEAEGVRRARERLAQADVIISLISANDDAGGVDLCVDGPTEIRVITKSDLGLRATSDGIPVSAVTGAGMDELLAALEQAARHLAGPRGAPALTRARHRMAIEEAVACLEAALTTDLPEICGEELRLAVRALGRITGSVGVEDVLDSVFSQFCIGK